MTVALVVVCKNEEAELLACLESAEPICDRYVIVDTGSTDSTREIAHAWLDDHRGQLYSARWHGFAFNRTEALELGRDSGADYLLMLDADHKLTIHGELPELTADEYKIPIKGSGNLAWSLPLLVKASRLWTYRGVAHSYLGCDDGPVVSDTLDSLSIAGGAGASNEKLERDRLALESDHRRTVFYLARTYDDLDRPLEAIPLYRERAEMGGYVGEVFYSRFRLGVLLGENVGFAAGEPELIAAWNIDRDRIEPLRALANLANSVADKACLPDGLFVNTSAYKAAAG